MTNEKIRKRNSKICGSRIPNVNRFVFTRNSLSNGLLLTFHWTNLYNPKSRNQGKGMLEEEKRKD